MIHDAGPDFDRHLLTNHDKSFRLREKYMQDKTPILNPWLGNEWLQSHSCIHCDIRKGNPLCPLFKSQNTAGQHTQGSLIKIVA